MQNNDETQNPNYNPSPNLWDALGWLRANVEHLIQGQRNLEAGQQRLEARIDTGQAETNQRIAETNQRIAETNQRIDKLLYAAIGLGIGLLTTAGGVISLLVLELVRG